MSIKIDPVSGLKVFNTRAAKASEKITGKGYSTITDEALKTLPPEPVGAVFDAEEQAKYIHCAYLCGIRDGGKDYSGPGPTVAGLPPEDAVQLLHRRREGMPGSVLV